MPPIEHPSTKLAEDYGAPGVVSGSTEQQAWAFHEQGRQCQIQGDLQAAEAHYRQALLLQPGLLRSLNNLAVLAMERFELAHAEAWLLDGLQRVSERGAQGWADPAAALLLNSLIQVRLQQQRPDLALAAAKPLVQLAPQAASWSNLAVALRWCGRHRGALGAQRLALPAPPEQLLFVPDPSGDAAASAALHVRLQNLATMQLSLDPWHLSGWSLLQARLACHPSHWQAQAVGHAPWQNRWSGELVDHLVLWDEQGFGDAIQALRWVAPAAQRCQRLTLVLRSSLVALVQKRLNLPSHVVIQLLEAQPEPWLGGQPHLPLMSLPLALAQPGQAAVLPPPPMFRCHRVNAAEPARLGLVWAAGRKPEPEPDRHARSRSLSLLQLMQLLQAAAGQQTFQLVSLQVGPDASEVDRGDLPWLIKQPDCLHTWEDTAKQLEHLDGLISVDTAVAHLAGSLGVPTALLLNRPCDWRWGQQGLYTPWYPSLTLLRLPELHAWQALVQPLGRWLAETLHAF